MGFHRGSDKCPDCGCPWVDLNHEYHYKHCPEIHWSRDPSETIGPHRVHSMKETIQSLINGAQAEIKYYKARLKHYGEVAKVVVEDEVYETRWDCIIMPTRVGSLGVA